MKKLLLTTACVCIFSAASLAQSLNATNVDYQLNGTTNDFILSAHATITNMSSVSIPVMCERTVNNLAGVHTSSFCWGSQCYPSNISISNGATVIAPGASETTFIGDLWVNGGTGTTTVTYNLYNEGNPSDNVGFTITYNITTPTGINDNRPDNLISTPRPNPADKYTSLSYALKSNPAQCKIEIVNMLGAKIAQYNFSNKMGVVIIPTDNLPSGLYFCALKENSKTIFSQKLIVSHK